MNSVRAADGLECADGNGDTRGANADGSAANTACGPNAEANNTDGSATGHSAFGSGSNASGNLGGANSAFGNGALANGDASFNAAFGDGANAQGNFIINTSSSSEPMTFSGSDARGHLGIQSHIPDLCLTIPTVMIETIEHIYWYNFLRKQQKLEH